MVYKEIIIFLGTKDLKKTSFFYKNVLGLTLYKDQGICQIFNITNEGKVGFCTHLSVEVKEKNPIITLVTEDVDKIYNKLVKAGVKISKPPEFNKKFKIYHFFLKDPNGYTLEIQKFLD
ncbi:MAG: VOC family protein [Candidatus Heimdallarchaeota archaeon]